MSNQTSNSKQTESTNLIEWPKDWYANTGFSYKGYKDYEQRMSIISKHTRDWYNWLQKRAPQEQTLP